jgi:hypothetical protein
MMEHRESNLTHRQRSNEASLAWLLVCTVGAALLAVMLVTQGALAQDSQDPSDGWFQKCGSLDDPQTPDVNEGAGQFDPIVFYNKPPPIGSQKLFFGATNISYNSTKDTLLTGGTTCRFKNGTDPGHPDPPSGGNRSAYWAFDLQLSNGKWAGGKQLNAYYRKGASSVDANDIVPFPDGLKMIISDRESSKTNVDWYCSNLNGEGNNGNMQARPYNCNATGTYPWVTAHITFPQCGAFDASGATGATDSMDHISHVVYPSSDGCPADHPIVYPRLFVTVKYATSLGKGALLAGGRDPGTSFTAYFFEAWQKDRLQFYIDNCIKAGINCNSTPPAG